MKRLIMDDLIAWKNSDNRKPLILQGARQVGKTWAIMELGRSEFDDIAYVNFLDDENMRRIFEGDLNPSRLLDAIRIQTGTNPQDGKTLVVFDEIQECPRALTSLKTFAERRPDLPIVAAGSLLGVALHNGASFPVGKVNHLDMHPMTFLEYLLATNPEMCAAIEARDFDMMNAFSLRYTEELKKYMFVGGMPEAVQRFVDTESYEEVRAIQERLLFDYEHDFSKHASPHLSERIRLIWASTPAQLGKENKKFVYSAVKKGARARGYEEAIQWLTDAGLLVRINRISKPGLPLASYEDKDAFKLYMFDTGLLGTACRLNTSTMIKGDSLFTEFKGSLTENYVCQQLAAAGSLHPCYWSSENSRGEVDFVYDFGGAVVPVEVKSETNLKSKSLKSFLSKYGIDQGIRLSLAGFEEQPQVVNVPLFAANVLPSWHPM